MCSSCCCRYSAEDRESKGRYADPTAAGSVFMSAAVVKNKSAKWLVELAEYMANHPEIIVEGFTKFGAAAALDGDMEDGEDSERSEWNQNMYIDNLDQ